MSSRLESHSAGVLVDGWDFVESKCTPGRRIHSNTLCAQQLSYTLLTVLQSPFVLGNSLQEVWNQLVIENVDPLSRFCLPSSQSET